MSAQVSVRLATSEEIGFVPSEIATEEIVVAEGDGEKAGLGGLFA